MFDLEAQTTFDAGVASAGATVPAGNEFRVLQPGGAPLEIAGLLTAKTGMAIAKMGAKTGWTEGTVGSPTITKVEGQAAEYPSWKANYSSLGGDSGSPILHRAGDKKWYLVGIHFSSGPRFQSWNNAEVTVGS